MADALWWLWGLLLLIGLVFLVGCGKTLLRYAALLAGVALVLTLAWALGAQATATQQVATAATVSAAGQTANSVAVTVLATLLGLTGLTGAGLGGYLWLRLRRAERQVPTGRWLPGPNAQWNRSELPASSDPLAQLVQLETLRYLRELRGPAAYPAAPALPVAEEDDALYTWPW